ncbi:MAG TPA: FHA domain-containing protein [bacterium]|nr:FHA domain-containing protein [bacterium]
MYKLICISGQNAPRSFILKEGDNTLGRAEESDLKVSSNGVSKKHAVITVKGNTVNVVDLGSKNGTFVNGVMIKKKELSQGDKIAIHDHVFQLVKGDLNAADLASVNSFDVPSLDEDKEYVSAPRTKASGLWGNINNFIETTVMPFFEMLMKRYPVAGIITILLVTMIVAVVLMVSIPVVQFDSYILDKETSQRAAYLATLLAEQNKDTIGSESPDPPSIKAVEDVLGVQFAVITDVEGKVLAPGERAGETIPVDRIKKILEGQSDEFKSVTKSGDIYKTPVDMFALSGGRYLVTAPIRTYLVDQGKYEYIGFAVLEFATAAVKQSMAGAWQRILVGIVLACFIGLIFSILISKIFSHPLLKIYDELDLAMKGESKRINFTFGSKEGKDLIELINILLRKSRRSSARSSAGGVDSLSQDIHGADPILVFESVGRSLRTPFFVLDTSKLIVTANQAFAVISGYRSGDWHGVPIVDAVREQRLLGVILDLISRSNAMGQDVSEEVMANEKVYRVSVSGLKNDRGEFNYHCISVEVV